MSETTKLCECGCGLETTIFRGKHRRFIKGHHLKCQTEETRLKKSKSMKGKMVGEKNPMYGKTHSLETRKKLSNASGSVNNGMYGKVSPMRGKMQSEDTKRNISIGLMGHTVSLKTRNKIGNANKGNKYMLGFKHSEATKERMSKLKKGKPLSEEHKKKISKRLEGNQYTLGYKHSNETKKRMGESHKGFKHSEKTKKKIGDAHRGDKHYNWMGGTSFEPYCEKFNNKFKESVREQFSRTCFLCGKTESEQMTEQKQKGKNQYRLSIHHVNYHKNCLCDDVKCEFVPLCVSCHTKTNSNRDYWEQFLIKKLTI